MSSKRECAQWMREHVHVYVDARTGEVNATRLAEACADAFNMSEEYGPLDSPDHWIWEVALHIANAHEAGRL